MLQHLLTEADIGGFDHELVSVYTQGAVVAADWGSLRSPETYVGYTRIEHVASPVGLSWTGVIVCRPERLRLNQWALTGEWTVKREATMLTEANGRIAYPFHARPESRHEKGLAGNARALSRVPRWRGAGRGSRQWCWRAGHRHGE